MYEFKRSALALVGVLILVGIATISKPHTGRGASGTGGSAPTSQTQNVNVVNTPSVNAQQSGTWNVGISGTPVVGLDASNNTVKIDSAAPVLVRDVDNPARQSFQQNGNAIINDGSSTGFMTFNLPAQKQAVIEYVSLGVRLPTGQKVYQVQLDTSPFQNSSQIIHHYFGSTFEGTADGFDYFVTSQPTRLYSAAKTESMRVLVFRNDSVGQGQVEVSISGYLLDP